MAATTGARAACATGHTSSQTLPPAQGHRGSAPATPRTDRDQSTTFLTQISLCLGLCLPFQAYGHSQAYGGMEVYEEVDILEKRGKRITTRVTLAYLSMRWHAAKELK